MVPTALCYSHHSMLCLLPSVPVCRAEVPGRSLQTVGPILPKQSVCPFLVGLAFPDVSAFLQTGQRHLKRTLLPHLDHFVGRQIDLRMQDWAQVKRFDNHASIASSVGMCCYTKADISKMKEKLSGTCTVGCMLYIHSPECRTDDVLDICMPEIVSAYAGCKERCAV